MDTPLEQLNAKIFNEQLHTQFRVHLDNGKTLPLELVEVEERNTSPKVELFFLRFLAPHAPRLFQKIHRLEHEKLGTIDIFITAISEDESGIQYESVFHRIIKKTASQQ
jgi:hypothetical protein